jgi:hypothetical protein
VSGTAGNRKDAKGTRKSAQTAGKNLKISFTLFYHFATGMCCVTHACTKHFAIDGMEFR